MHHHQLHSRLVCFAHFTQLFFVFGRFRVNDLMKTMATKPEFLVPLGRFRKRLAYANAYGTDFPVPAETAAFLSAESTYPHHFVEEGDGGEDCVVIDDDTGLVIATMQTPPQGKDQIRIDRVSPTAPRPSLDHSAFSHTLRYLFFACLRKTLMIWCKCPLHSTRWVGRKSLWTFGMRFRIAYPFPG